MMDIVAYLVKQKVDSLNQENTRLKEEHSRLLFFNREMAEENTNLKKLIQELSDELEALKGIIDVKKIEICRCKVCRGEV